MILGRVVSLQILIPVTFRRPDQPDVVIECVVDTGFEGALTLPTSAVVALSLPFVTDLNTTLANDMAFTAPVHKATVIWNGREVNVAVLALGRQPLLGTALLAEHRLDAAFTDNGVVMIDETA